MVNTERHDVVHQIVFICYRIKYTAYATLFLGGRYFIKTEMGGGLFLHNVINKYLTIEP